MQQGQIAHDPQAEDRVSSKATEAAELATTQDDRHRNRWPKTLVEMIDACSAALRRKGFDKPRSDKLALLVVGEICQLFGGRVVYLPRGTAIKNIRRELDVLASVESGRDIHLVADDFGVTVTSVYRMCARVRAHMNIDADAAASVRAMPSDMSRT